MLGGAIFAAVFTALAVGVYHEASRMTPLIGVGSQLNTSGYIVIVCFASLALLTREPWGIALAIAIGTLLPGTMIFRANTDADSFMSLMVTMAMALYVGLGVHAAIALRRTAGDLEIGWANDLGAYSTLSGDSAALGMAWTMVAIAATWLSDTCAMFVGRTIGKTPLIPHISPKKTLEGAAGAVLGAVVATVGLVILFGIPDVPVPLAITIGVLFAVIGIYGDLLESFIKRSAGVKDSGHMIPGHGGIFDRIDGLMPTLLVAWVVATAVH